jgi:hypothetical protein
MGVILPPVVGELSGIVLSGTGPEVGALTKGSADPTVLTQWR